MSASQIKGSGSTGRFIPTLTEIIEAPVEQMDLGLLPDAHQSTNNGAPDEPVFRPQPEEQVQEFAGQSEKTVLQEQQVPQTVKVPSYGVNVKPADPRPKSAPKTSSPSAPPVLDSGQVHIAVGSGSDLQNQVQRLGKQGEPSQLVKSPHLPQPRVPKAIEEKTAAKRIDLPETDTKTSGQSEVDDQFLTALPPEPELQPDIFSPLARNPGASSDALRPSDLMLVALSERIAAKARIRIEKNLEQHIQDHIFPLLDHFADQLVTHIQGDLLKIMREGIAEATREELERLGQRNK